MNVQIFTVYYEIRQPLRNLAITWMCGILLLCSKIKLKDIIIKVNCLFVCYLNISQWNKINPKAKKIILPPQSFDQAHEPNDRN